MEGGAGVAIEEPHEKRKSHRVAALATSGSPQPFIHKKAAAASEQQDDTARQCAMRHILPQSLPLELNIGGQRFTTSLQTLIVGAQKGSAIFEALVAQVAGSDWNENRVSAEELIRLLHQVDFELFIDRDPLPYPHILRYLRTGTLCDEVDCATALRLEAQYLGLTELLQIAVDLPDLSRSRVVEIINQLPGRLQLPCASLQHILLKKFDLKGSNLRGVCLRGADLSYCQLSGADLREADLSYCNLEGCCLDGADLRGSIMLRANLTNATMSKAKLASAVLSKSNITAEQISTVDTDLAGVDLTGLDLSGANLEWFRLSGCILRNCQLSGANLSKTLLFGAIMDGCKLDRSNHSVLSALSQDQALVLQSSSFDNFSTIKIPKPVSPPQKPVRSLAPGKQKTRGFDVRF